MFLAEDEIPRTIERVKAAFPHFGGWQYTNEKDHSYDGFCVWGQYNPAPKDRTQRLFYVTFAPYGATYWAGYLTIGQHSYYWSSASAGDAYLLGTNHNATLDDAIAALKEQIAALFAALSASTKPPGQ